MLKIFLRKRFVCGNIEILKYGHAYDEPDTTYCRWNVSFDTSEEARIFLSYDKDNSVLYDKKTKVTIKKRKSIVDYFEEIKSTD